MDSQTIINLAECVVEAIKLSQSNPETQEDLQNFASEAVKGVLTGNSERLANATKHCAGRLLNVGVSSGNMDTKRLAGRLLNAGKKISPEPSENLLNRLLG